MNFGHVCIMPVKPKHMNELSKSNSIVVSLSHPEHGSVIFQISKMHGGIKLGNKLLVPILLKSHEIIDMFALTCIYNLLEQMIIGLFHTPTVNTLCLYGNLPIPQYHRLIKVLLVQSVKSGIS